MTHKERAILWLAFKEEYESDAAAISLRDRDREPPATVGDKLHDYNYEPVTAERYWPREWRMRHIEGYLLWPEAIAKQARPLWPKSANNSVISTDWRSPTPSPTARVRRL